MPRHADPAADINGTELVRLAKLYELPDFVKKADLETTMRPESPVVTIYADPRHREFPCHTGAATYLSALYFAEKQAEFHPKDRAAVLERLDSYVNFHGIRGDVTRMRDRFTELHKTAESQLPDSSYAYVWVGEDGHKDRHLPLRSAVEVKAAAEWLHEYCDQIPFADRNKIAVRILEKQASFGAGLGELTEFVDRQAGRGVCNPAEVVTQLQSRAHLAKTAEQRELIQRLAHAVMTAPKISLLPERLVKLATTLDTIDRALNLAGHYGSVIRRPEDVIFSATFTKAAAEVETYVPLSTGRVYEKDTLRKVAIADLRSVFGPDFVDRVTTNLELDPEKMAEELSALPRPDAELMESVLSEAGINPVLSKSASAVGFTEEQFSAMADNYFR